MIKVYSYGAKAPLTPEEASTQFGLPSSPTSIIQDQLWSSHLYRNKLVEIEQHRIQGVRELYRQLSPELATAYLKEIELEGKVDDAYLRLSKVKDASSPGHSLPKARRNESPEAQTIMTEIKELRGLQKKNQEVSKILRKKVSEQFKVGDEALKLAKLTTSLEWVVSNAKETAERKAKATTLLNSNISDHESFKKAVFEAFGKAIVGPRHIEQINETLYEKFQNDSSMIEAWKLKEKIQKENNDACKKARTDSNCLSGSYTAVEAAAKKSFQTTFNPRFVRYDGQGRVGIQLAPSMTVKEALACSKNKLQIRFDDRPVRGNKNASRLVDSMPDATVTEVIAVAAKVGIKLHAHHVVEIRNRTKSKIERYNRSAVISIGIGTNSKQFIHVPVVMHRALPEDGVISWVWLQVNKVGTQRQYEIQFTVESETFEKPLNENAKELIALNLGWRALDDGDIRIATTFDGENTTVINLPGWQMSNSTNPGLRKKQEKAEDLLSFADRHFDDVKKDFAVWLKTADMSWLSKTMQKKLASFVKWRSHGRMANLVFAMAQKFLEPKLIGNMWQKWKTERLSKRLDLFDRFQVLDSWFASNGISDTNQRMALCLEWWRRKDSHLIDWARNIQLQIRRFKLDTYRCLAAQWSKQYKKIVVQEWDLSQTALTPELDTRTKQQENAAGVRQLAGVSLLRMAAKAKFGDDLIKIDSSYTTQPHFGCGGEGDDPVPAIELFCDKCNKIFDQDTNASSHLWNRAVQKKQLAA